MSIILHKLKIENNEPLLLYTQPLLFIKKVSLSRKGYVDPCWCKFSSAHWIVLPCKTMLKQDRSNSNSDQRYDTTTCLPNNLVYWFNDYWLLLVVYCSLVSLSLKVGRTGILFPPTPHGSGVLIYSGTRRAFGWVGSCRAGLPLFSWPVISSLCLNLGHPLAITSTQLQLSIAAIHYLHPRSFYFG